MSNLSQVLPADIIEKVVAEGDLSSLNPAQRTHYLIETCRSLGLNHLTKPFEFIRLNGKLVMYAKRDATDQLRKIHSVSISISCREKIGDIYVVTAKARDRGGREDESTGAVNIANLSGDALANAFLKAETKAKRRVTLSICGLGFLDETEIETIEPRQVQAIEQIPSDPSEFLITFGKFKNQKMGECNPYEIKGYVQWLHEGQQKTGKPFDQKVLNFIQAAEAFIASRTPQEEVVSGN